MQTKWTEIAFKYHVFRSQKIAPEKNKSIRSGQVIFFDVFRKKWLIKF